MKYSAEELESIYASILNRESPIMVLVGSVTGAVLGLSVFYLFALIGWAFIVAMLIPSAFAGFGASFLGKPINAKYRAISGIVGAAIYVLGTWLLFGFDPLLMLLAPVGFFIAYYFSKAKLSKEETQAIWQKSVSGG